MSAFPLIAWKQITEDIQTYNFKWLQQYLQTVFRCDENTHTHRFVKKKKKKKRLILFQQYIFIITTDVSEFKTPGYINQTSIFNQSLGKYKSKSRTKRSLPKLKNKQKNPNKNSFSFLRHIRLTAAYLLSALRCSDMLTCHVTWQCDQTQH